MPLHSILYYKADAGITDEAAADFVARVTHHIPLGTALNRPLVVGTDPAHPGIPASLLDGSAALWTLPAGDDSADRMMELESGGFEVVKYRNGNEVSRQVFK
ncbi:MAG TPA: hypothetical protein VFV01_29350 [Spirillospora sp.]|nr:hypothetical protein [Spirillospora sp.]